MTEYDKLLNATWILTKWCHQANGMSEFKVRITGLCDGPDGSTWAIIEGAGDREISMPLHEFEKQAVLDRSHVKAFYEGLSA